MNPFPSPLLCLYCDKIILPGNKEGCRDHIFECKHHPAKGMVDALNKILNVVRSEQQAHWDTLDKIDRIAEDALR